MPVDNIAFVDTKQLKVTAPTVELFHSSEFMWQSLISYMFVDQMSLCKLADDISQNFAALKALGLYNSERPHLCY